MLTNLLMRAPAQIYGQRCTCWPKQTILYNYACTLFAWLHRAGSKETILLPHTFFPHIFHKPVYSLLYYNQISTDLLIFVNENGPTTDIIHPFILLLLFIISLLSHGIASLSGRQDVQSQATYYGACQKPNHKPSVQMLLFCAVLGGPQRVE